MLKQLVLLLLEFGAGLAGNLVAGWIQQDVWSNLFTPVRLLGTLSGAALMLLTLAWLESERALPWNWRWHRYWYLREVLGDPDLWRWEVDFARLEAVQKRRKVSAAEVSAEGKRHDLVELLHDLITSRWGEVRRALVLGEPGSGKTTGLERLTLDLAREGARRLGLGRSMPVLVRLGNFQEGKLLEYVGQAMRHGTRGGSGKVLGKGIDELVEQGRVVLLFDALDEALGKRREVVLAELGNFLESRAYADVPMVITSRTREDPGGRLAGLQAFEIQDLNDEAVEVFIRAYKRAEQSEEEIRKRLEGHGLLESGGLGRNPFWLRLIVESGAFEGNKGQILNQAVNNLLAREWEKPEAGWSWRRVLPRAEQLEETKRGLAWLGYRMSVENQVVLNWGRTLVELAKWLKGRLGVEELKPQDVLELGRDAQVLMYQPGPVQFRHRLLQEFMTAWALAIEEGLLTQELERCVQDSGWWETLLMLGGLVQDHAILARAVLGNGRDYRQLFLAVGLLRSVDKPDRELERQVMAALVDSLRRGVTPNHKQAAVELARRIAGDEVVEALDWLLRVEDQTVKEGAVEILGEIGSSKAAEVLTGSLRDEAIVGLVTNVLVSLGELAVEPLIGALRDRDSGVRRGAAWALGEIGDAQAVEPLIAALRDEDSDVCLGAAKALGKIGESAMEPLIRTLADKDWDVRWRAPLTLVWIGDARWRATEALGEIGDARAVEPLINALQDEDDRVRWQAAEALAKIGEPAVEPLIRTLADKDWDVRWGAAKALREIGEPAVASLIAALRDEDSNVRWGAVEILGEIREPAVKPLIAALRDEDSHVRWVAAWTLGQIGDAKAVEPLIATLREDGNVRVVAVWALGKIGEPAVEPLIAALRDEDSNVRWGAAWALGEIGDARAVKPLIAALRDEDSGVRWKAAEILGKIGDARALPELERVAREDTGVTPWGERVAYVAEDAARRIRERRGQ